MEIIMKADRIHKTLPRTRPAWVYMPALYGVAFDWRCGVARCIAEFFWGNDGRRNDPGQKAVVLHRIDDGRCTIYVLQR
jgi:hypothetical protein